jgi:tRNA threonylcarbamoyl adenosine modification protein (Sua5/YciO/YrdC/YwlC family)
MITQRIKIQSNWVEASALEIASAAILQGKIIAIPTDTYYALAGDPFNLQTVDLIFQAKGRQSWKPLLLLIDSVDQAETIAQNIPDRFYKIAEAFWPGPLTLILPAGKNVPLKVTGGTGTVGIRIPACNFTRMLANAIDRPLIGTSANLTTHPACASAEEVLEQLGGKIELVIDAGKSAATTASTIVDLTQDPPKIAREGATPLEQLHKYLIS